MSERIFQGPRPISIDDLRDQDKLRFWKGNKLGSIIADIAPQVALWQMAKESTDEVLSTNSARVIDYVREKYFLVSPKDLIYPILFFLDNKTEEGYNFGLSFSVPGKAEWPKGASGTKRFYFVINYPKNAEKYRFRLNLKPENLKRITGAAGLFGKENSLWALYCDGKRMLEEETGFEFPLDHKTPEWLRLHWQGLNRRKFEREVREAETAIRKTFANVKDHFNNTEEAHKRGEWTDRIGALFDLTMTFNSLPLLDRTFPIKAISFDCQWKRDSNLLMGVVSRAENFDDYVKLTLEAITKRAKNERDYRRAINDMYVELYSVDPKQRSKMMLELLKASGFYDGSNRLSEEVLWDQMRTIGWIRGYFKSSGTLEEALEKIRDNWRFETQDVEEVVLFLAERSKHIPWEKFIESLEEEEY